ncbi:Shedu anti-phage system protein SduA domain-containing protein [Streptomyces sp. NPDC001530]|uniref:Shedu anti-phage system protein SduA domain-containing protein n=1 Tax=Streptomyces sp. NPDC001530 TaxID=3364582 RepID=UPI0036838DB0
MNDCVEYANYVAAEMKRNGYARHCVARGDVDEQLLAAYEVELNAATDERPLQRFFEEHPGILAQELGAACRWVLPQVSLGGRYVPDFLVARIDSGGVRWTLVELESPTAQLFTKDGQPRKELRKGLSQIQDWRDWLTANRDVARRSRTDQGLGLIGIDHMASGLVIIGRRHHRLVADQERLNSLVYRERVLIRSYDWLLDEARGRIRIRGELARSGAVMCEDCDLPGRSFQ